MTCTLATAVKGDVDDVREVALLGGDLSDTDLVGATVEGHVWPVLGGAAVDLAGSVVSAARKIISVNLGALAGWLSSADPVEYFIEYEVSFADGRVWTWPSQQPDRILVRDEGDA